MSAAPRGVERAFSAAGGARRGALGVVRAVLAGMPRAAWVCAVVCVLNAAAWGLVTPPFQVVDEEYHYSYVEYLVEHGRPPHPAPPRMSPSERVLYDDAKMLAIAGNPDVRAISSAAEERQLRHDLARSRSRDGSGGSLSAEPEPPLYYVLQAVPFTLGGSGTVLDRLALMRLLSALLSGVTVLFTFLFLREALPAIPWTWTVGALGVAFQPLFASMAAGVNPDNMLFAVSAALFFLLARIFRHGLTERRAALVGGVLALGFLTKINFVGLLPGAVLGLVAAALRQERAARAPGAWRRAPRLPALALGVAAVPVAAEMALNTLAWGRPAYGTGIYTTHGVHPEFVEAVRFVWLFWLPPLPSFSFFPIWHNWLRQLISLFNWFETTFPPWVISAAIAPLTALAALGMRTLVVERRALRARAAELATYGALAGGLPLLIALSSYNLFLQRNGGAVEGRYLLPLLPLYGGALVLATRGLGRRWVPVLGTAIVLLALAHNLFALLLEVSRYYG